MISSRAPVGNTHSQIMWLLRLLSFLSSCVALHKGQSGRNLLGLSRLAWSQSSWKVGWLLIRLPPSPERLPTSHNALREHQKDPYWYLCCGLKSTELSAPLNNTHDWSMWDKPLTWCHHSEFVTFVFNAHLQFFILFVIKCQYQGKMPKCQYQGKMPRERICQIFCDLHCC